MGSKQSLKITLTLDSVSLGFVAHFLDKHNFCKTETTKTEDD